MVIDYLKRNEILELKLNLKLLNVDICNVLFVFIIDNDVILILVLIWYG